MNLRAVANTVSFLLLLLSLGMFLSAGFGFIYDYPETGGPLACRPALHLIACGLATALPALAVFLVTRRRRGEPELQVGIREGFASVAFGWAVASCFCGLPFILSAHFRLADAIFETAAGLTTTGASIISDKLVLSDGTLLDGGLESLSHALLFWRCLLNWFGGVGIVFFALLVQPFLSMNRGAMLYNAEVPGLKTDNSQLAPRVRNSVLMLTVVYLTLTALAALVYSLCGMSFFDAICHAFSSVSTGGFSTHADSLGAFNSPALHWAAIFMMFVSACNFTLILKLLTEGKFIFWQDEEFRFFLKMVLGAVLITTLLIWFNCPDGLPLMGASSAHPRTLEYYLRLAAFHVISLASTTGYAISDYDAWHIPPILILFFLIMFPAGCGGSTAGGMKCSRIIVVAKHALYEIRHCLSPRTVCDIRLSGERIPPSMISKTTAFIGIYVAVVFAVASVILFACGGTSISTAFGAALTCISNVGPGFGQVGPALSFGWMSAPVKLLLSLTMVAGRLELYTICVLFLPSFWRR